MLERDNEMECNTMQYQLKVVPWHLLYHIIFHCHVSWTGLPITSFMSHLMARHLLKILTCNKSCSWEQRLGEFVEILVAQKMPSNSYTIARCISLLRQLWKSWTEISSKTMNTWEPAERNTHHTIVKVEGKQFSCALTMTWWVVRCFDDCRLWPQPPRKPSFRHASL